MTTALVLCGGGSLGAIQVGMLQALVEFGLAPDLIVGVSAGALNGAFLAAGADAATTQRMAGLWRRARTREILGLSWRSALGLAGLRDHIGDSRGLRALLERELGGLLIEQLAIPLYVVCADFATGEAVVLARGSLVEATLASSAIPGVFAAVRIDGRDLVDGAIASETPIAVAARLGASRVIVLPCGFACVGTAVPRHALGRAMHAVTLLGARQLRLDYERHAAQLELRIVPPLCPLNQSASDYSQGAALIDRALAATRAWLDSGGLDQAVFPGGLQEHRH